MHCFIRLVYSYLGFLFGIFEISDMFVSLIYAAMVLMNFRLAEFVYDRFLFEVLQANEKLFHEFFKYLHRVMENTIYAFLNAMRDILFAFLCGVIPKLPDPIRYPLDLMGVTLYLEKSVNRSMEDKKKKDREYMEYAKKIEKNRPISPAHKDKISFNQDAKPSQDTKKIYDPQTKQFKLVPVEAGANEIEPKSGDAKVEESTGKSKAE